MFKRNSIWLALYGALWAVCLLVLRGRANQSVAQLVVIFLVLGVGFSVVAVVVTLGYEPLSPRVRAPREEVGVLLGCLLVFGVYFAFLSPFITRGFPGEHSQQWLTLVIKLLMFIAIPSALFLLLFGYELRDLMPMSWSWRKLLPALWLGLAMIGFQIVFGSGLNEIRESNLPLPTLIF
ncbi:MAG: hypothetical protein JOZ43_05750, partial [Acidobacteriales bacterium]|nr:hypothetical protein [Terriglobales bacterium]